MAVLTLTERAAVTVRARAWRTSSLCSIASWPGECRPRLGTKRGHRHHRACGLETYANRTYVTRTNRARQSQAIVSETVCSGRFCRDFLEASYQATDLQVGPVPWAD